MGAPQGLTYLCACVRRLGNAVKVATTAVTRVYVRTLGPIGFPSAAAKHKKCSPYMPPPRPQLLCQFVL